MDLVTHEVEGEFTSSVSEVLVIEPLDWRSLIISYLRDGAPPSTDTESTKLRFKATRYILIDDCALKHQRYPF